MARYNIRRYRPRPAPVVDSRQVSYTGMRDSKDPSAASSRKASYLLNVFPVLSEYGGGLEGRPGYSQIGATLTGRAQLIFQFSKLNGSEYTVVISGGKFYVYNWGTNTLVETLTAAQLAGAAISLHASAKVSAVIFADQMVISDGVNTPWMWDGTTGAGMTKLTNAPVAYGQPTVYYAKLFFIKNAERTTIVWSEENLANTGYEAGGYNNAWTLGQTDQESLYAIFGTNSALYYWRANSMGSITGAVTNDFRSTGTQDGISQSIGTTSPWSVLFHNDAFFFIDAQGHPQRYVLGAGMQYPPIWHDAKETTARLSAIKFSNIRALYRPAEDVVQIPYTPIGVDENNLSLLYGSDTGEFLAVWQYATNVAEIALVKNGAGALVVIHGTEDAKFFVHGSHDAGTYWSDAGVKITHTIWGAPLLWDPREEKYFSRLDTSFRLESNLTNIGFSFVTPDSTVSGLNPGTVTGGLSLWGVAIWGVSVWSTGSVEVHLTIGLENRGRWGQPRLTHDTLNERFVFIGWTVLAHPAGRDPGIN